MTAALTLGQKLSSAVLPQLPFLQIWSEDGVTSMICEAGTEQKDLTRKILGAKPVL